MDKKVVEVDPETGDVTYVISVEDPEVAEEAQEALKNEEEFIQNVNEAIENTVKIT